MKRSPSQTDQILQALLRGESISQLEALDRFGSMRLGARIEELRKRGYDIQTRAESRNGKHYARYWLKVEPPALPPAFPPKPVENQSSLFQ
jgi:hypothetical protein